MDVLIRALPLCDSLRYVTSEQWRCGRGGRGGAIAPPAALKTGAPNYSLGAKMTAEVSEVCMVSHCRVSLIKAIGIDITKLKRSNYPLILRN